MWTCSQLKDNAKKVLGRYYWMSVLVSFVSMAISSAVLSFATGTVSGIVYVPLGFISGIFSSVMGGISAASDSEGVAIAGSIAVLLILGLVYVVIYAIMFVVSALGQGFITYPLSVGLDRYFLNGRYGKEKFEDIFFSINSKRYKNVAVTSFFMVLYIMLWSLLFFIPGIIKGYEYFLIPYILADNPNIDRKRAFEISAKVMDGEKWHCFVLGLSFIGWAFLAVFATFGIGVVFLIPYMQATYVEFYSCMKEKAISTGIVSAEELGGVQA